MFNNYLIVIPTFNESGNIKKLVNKLVQYDFHVLVVDDNSPDNTFDIVKITKVMEKICLEF